MKTLAMLITLAAALAITATAVADTDDEPNNNELNTATPVKVPSILDGMIYPADHDKVPKVEEGKKQTGDWDIYTLTLPKGKTLEIFFC